MKSRDLSKRVYTYRLDGNGRWHYGKNPVTDPDLARDFFAGLQQEPDGSWSFLCEGERCRAVVEDVPQFVERLEAVTSPDGGALEAVGLVLGSGTSEMLDPGTLRSGTGGALYCTLKSGQSARFHRLPQLELARWVSEEADGAAVLRIAGRSFPVTDEKQ
ncbi:MAG: DUF1285 domain-containing protein [Deltaproteobacteria bacterium]|nr:DUF1285 domain-containing protein [Deltaproteobacteria bacterium]